MAACFIGARMCDLPSRITVRAFGMRSACITMRPLPFGTICTGTYSTTGAFLFALPTAASCCLPA